MNDTSQPPLLDIDELVQQIKLQALERDKQLAGEAFQPVDTENSFLAAIAPLTEQQAEARLPMPTEFKHRDDFLVYEGREFIRYAYLGILLREPDATGMDNYLKFLQSGGSREAVLAKLMLSDEGLDKGVAIQGMHQLLARTRKLKKKWWMNKKVSKLAYEQDLFFQPIHTPVLRIQKELEQQARIQQDLHSQTKQIELETKAVIDLVGQQSQSLQRQLTEISNQLSSQQQQQQEQFSSINSLLVIQQQEQQSQIKLIQSENAKKIAQLEQQLVFTQDQLGEVRRQFSYQQRNQDLFLQQLIKDNQQKLADLAESESTADSEQEQQQLLKWQQLLEQHSVDKLDAYYIAFEDACRGTREDIKNNFREYLPLLEKAITDVGTQKSQNEKQLDVLDLGCGRGEWLQLLNENGWLTAGVDTNKMMVQDCVKLGLNVQDADVSAYLKRQASDSIKVISAFHLIEHIPFAELLSLFEEAIRVLKPGGMVVFETPNPENLLVGSHTFYHDSTHRNPLTPTAMEFLARYTGFTKIQILRLHPYPDAAKVPGNDPLTERVNGHLCGPQDYAIIAYKPAHTLTRHSAVSSPE